jgi:hypothetical protein
VPLGISVSPTNGRKKTSSKYPRSSEGPSSKYPRGLAVMGSPCCSDGKFTNDEQEFMPAVSKKLHVSTWSKSPVLLEIKDFLVSLDVSAMSPILMGTSWGTISLTESPHHWYTSV